MCFCVCAIDGFDWFRFGMTNITFRTDLMTIVACQEKKRLICVFFGHNDIIHGIK